jgi:hypothetical protein
MSRSIHHLIFGFVVALALLTPWTAVAQPRKVELHSITPLSLYSMPADFLAQAWALFSRFWDKAGCGIDPSGAEAGCGIDPNGIEAGCGIDPDGNCSTALPTPPVQGEEGCGIDPNGLCVK